MKHKSKIKWPKLLGYPVMHDINFIDFITDRLTEKVCPIHNDPLYLFDDLHIPENYYRRKYRCKHKGCLCQADFVGDELKSDVMAITSEYVWSRVEGLNLLRLPNSIDLTEMSKAFIPFTIAPNCTS